MDRTSIDALIGHESAALRNEFPRVDECRARLESLSEDLAQRFSLGLDIRLPQSQLLVCGKAKHDAHAAVYAAFEEARERLAEHERRFA